MLQVINSFETHPIEMYARSGQIQVGRISDATILAAHPKDLGGKAMDKKSHIQQTGRARGKLRRLEQDLRRAKGDLSGIIRNRIVGGAIVVIGLSALIVFFVQGSRFSAVIAVISLIIGGLVSIRALMKIGVARRSIDTITDGVVGAQATLTELEGQPSTAE
jgi:Flp pilus assembly protein TadB